MVGFATVTADKHQYRNLTLQCATSSVLPILCFVFMQIFTVTVWGCRFQVWWSTSPTFSSRLHTSLLRSAGRPVGLGTTITTCSSLYRRSFGLRLSSMRHTWPRQRRRPWVSITNMLGIKRHPFWRSGPTMWYLEISLGSIGGRHPIYVLGESILSMFRCHKQRYSAHQLGTISSSCWSSVWCCSRLFDRLVMAALSVRAGVCKAFDKPL